MKKPGKMIAEVFRSLFKKPATVLYPFEASTPSKTLRGKLRFYQELCIGCKICERDCPSDAIKVTKIADKRFEVELDLGKCVYCAQCVDSCPKKALACSHEFELAGYNRESLKVKLDAGPDGKPEEKTPEEDKKAV